MLTEFVMLVKLKKLVKRRGRMVRKIKLRIIFVVLLRNEKRNGKRHKNKKKKNESNYLLVTKDKCRKMAPVTRTQHAPNL